MVRYLRDLPLGAKVSVLGASSVLAAALALVGLATWQSGEYNALARGEVDELVNTDLDHIARGIYSLVETEDQAVQQQVDYNLNVARYVLAKAGGVELARATADWTARNQFTGESVDIRLPQMAVAGEWLGQNTDPAVETRVVDEVTRMVGDTATIFQRMNSAGDMLRVATTVRTSAGERAIGTYIPAVEPSGVPNPVIATILRGDTYHGRAYVVDTWYLTAYEAITDSAGHTVGMLYVGVKQATVESRVRQAVLQTKVGKTGYLYVLGSQGERRGRYVISQRGERDGEDVWENRDSDGRYVIQAIIAKGTVLAPGELATERYRWQNPGEPAPRWKVARVAYYAPWDWVIGTSAYEDELQNYEAILSAGRARMTAVMGVAGLGITLLIGFVGVLAARTIARPLRQMTGMAETITRGDLSQVVDVHSRDEIGTLAAAFNFMTRELRQTMESLQKVRQELEQRVLALRASEQKYRQIVETSQEGIIAIDEDACISYVNQHMAAFLGYAPAELLGHPLSELMVPEELADHAARIAQRRAGKAERYERRYRSRDGRVIVTQTSATPVFDDAGRYRGSLGMLTDITDRKRAEEAMRESERRLELALEISQAGVWEVDLRTGKVMVDARTLKLLGYEPGEIGETLAAWRDRTHPADREAVRVAFEAHLRGQTERYAGEHRILRKDGTWTWAEYCGRVVERGPDGAPLRAIGTHRDIAERKAAEEQLRRQMEEIERFNVLAVEREVRVIELKRRINELTVATGAAAPYDLSQIDVITPGPASAGGPAAAEVAASERAAPEQDLTQLLANNSMRRLLDNFSDSVGLAAAILDLSGTVLIASRWHSICTDFHRNDETTRARCLESDTVLAGQLREGERFSLYQCRNGLTDAASPVLIEGRHVANVFVGQFLLDAPDEEHFRRQAAEFGFDEAAYLDALRQVPVLAREQLDAILALLTGCAEMVGAAVTARLRGRAAEAKLERWTEDLSRANQELRRQRAAAISLAEDANDGRTAAERMQRALAESEQRYRNFIANATEGIYRIDFTEPIPIDRPPEEAAARIERCAIIGEVNEAFARMYGLGAADMLGRPARDFSPDYGQRGALVLQRANYQVADEETVDRRADGQPLHLSEHFTGVVEGGKLVRIWGVQRDISARKRAEEALRESEKQFRSLFMSLSEGFYISEVIHDDDGNPCDYRYLEVNPKFEEILGLTRDQVIGKRYTELVPADTTNWLTNYCEVARTAIPRTYEFHSPEYDKYFETYAYQPIKGQVSVFVRDITERKRAEEALRRSAERHQTVLRTAMDGFLLIDADGRVLEVNEAYCRMSGYSEQELLMMDVRDLEASEPPPEVTAHIGRVREQGRDRFESQHRRKDGRLVDVEVSIQFAPTCGGQVAVFVRDITERKRAEKNLQESEANLRAILASTDDIIASYDRDLRLVVYNTACRDVYRQMFGVEIHPGLQALELFPESQRGLWTTNNARALAGETFSAEFSLPAADGQSRFFETFFNPIRWGDEVAGFSTFTRDVTERKRAEAERDRLEAQLRQAQKMEAIGQLAGGVAHDFNNILTAIFGNVELALGELQQQFPTARGVIDGMRQIEKSAQRASQLTRQLLAFSRRQVIRPEVLSINTTLRDLEKMLRRLITENIELRFRCDPDLRSVKVDPGQLEQVIVNLVVNARDAMRDGGRLTLETRNVVFDEAYLATHSEAQAGPHVLLAVSDTGCGMDRATLERVFEPFFTTKPAGEGTGLGLSMVYGIVRQAGGSVGVYSEPGRGTTFRIYLPIVQEAVATLAREADTGPLPSGTETLLICEDDTAVRELTAYILKEAGYTVLVAAQPEEALRLAAAASGPLDLLITDVIMPDMNGRKLSDALMGLRPGVRTLFVSGYTSNVIAHHGVLEENVEFLEKPYSRRQLLQRVREVLAGAQPRRKP